MVFNREIALATLGLALLLIGCGYRVPRLAERDTRLFQYLYRGLGAPPLTAVFQLAWPLGTTPIALAGLLLLILRDARLGLPATVAYAGALGLERTLKSLLKRPRPFEAVPGIALKQLRAAADPSFPSGDAMRAWFLTMVIAAGFGLAWPYVCLGVLLALIVTVGRVALGAHYPLDALGGAGLGLLAAGLSLLLS